MDNPEQGVHEVNLTSQRSDTLQEQRSDATRTTYGQQRFLFQLRLAPTRTTTTATTTTRPLDDNSRDNKDARRNAGPSWTTTGLSKLKKKIYIYIYIYIFKKKKKKKHDFGVKIFSVFSFPLVIASNYACNVKITMCFLDLFSISTIFTTFYRR